MFQENLSENSRQAYNRVSCHLITQNRRACDPFVCRSRRAGRVSEKSLQQNNSPDAPEALQAQKRCTVVCDVKSRANLNEMQEKFRERGGIIEIPGTRIRAKKKSNFIDILQKSNILYCSTSNAGRAQLVEQLICNQQVVGSSPIASSVTPVIVSGR